MSKRISYIAYILGRRQEISKIFNTKPMIYINSGKSLTLNSSPISIPLKKGKYTVQVFYNTEKSKLFVEKNFEIKEDYNPDQTKLGKLAVVGKSKNIEVSKKGCKEKRNIPKKYECRFQAALISYYSRPVKAKLDTSDKSFKFSRRYRKHLKFGTNVAQKKTPIIEIKGRFYVDSYSEILEKNLKFNIKSSDGYLSETDIISFTYSGS